MRQGCGECLISWNYSRLSRQILSIFPKPYENMQYPGQRVQIDVKYVPDACIVGDAKSEGRKFYQYTAINEYSRFCYLEAFEEHSSYSSAVFLEHMLKAFKFKIECVQTDNGQEFTKRFGSSEKPSIKKYFYLSV